MRASLLCTALIAGLALPAAGAAAGEGVELSIKSRSLAASSAPAPSKDVPAPFLRHARDPMPELRAREEPQLHGPSGACENSASALCYDMADGRIVYRGARAFMPQFDGLQAESISLRRDRIILRYSF